MKYYLYKFWESMPISQEYGLTDYAKKMWERYLKTGKRLYRYKIHTGIDYNIPIGTKIKSPINGIIVKVDNTDNSGIGKNISIIDTNQLIGCRFYHLNSLKVCMSQNIKAGDLLAESGNTGIGTGAHLHFEVVTINKDGIAIGNYNGAIDPLGENIVWLDNPADCV